jgi:hypothetical protein
MSATPECEAPPTEAARPLSVAQIARNKLAGTARQHGADHPAVEAVRAELRDAKAESAIRRIVDAAPPLSQETRNRLAAILTDA